MITDDRVYAGYGTGITAASCTLAPPGSGRCWKILQVVVESDAASKVVTVKYGSTVAGATTAAMPSLPIGDETVIAALEGFLGLAPDGGAMADNQALVIAVTGASACGIRVDAVSIDTPRRDSSTGNTVSS